MDFENSENLKFIYLEKIKIFGLNLDGVEGVEPKSIGFIFDLLTCEGTSEAPPPPPPPENSANPYKYFLFLLSMKKK